MDITDLSDILSEPIFNELADHILNDIDLHELDDYEIYSDSTRIRQGLTEGLGQTACAFPNSTTNANPAGHTLEALLRSANPPSRVPPAPELHSDTYLKKEQYVLGNRLFRDSPSVLSQSAPLVCINHAVKNPSTQPGRSKLIFQHFENSPTTNWNSRDVTNQPQKVQLCVIPDRRTASNQASSMVMSRDEMQEDDDKGSGISTGKRAPHNAIEKRYRASINGRIDELRRILQPYRSCDEKLNKSAVLRKAIECIRNLEETNRALRSELNAKGDRRDEHTTSKTSPDSGISSLERSPVPRSLTCQSSLSSSDNCSFTSSPGLERHPCSQPAPSDGFPRLDTPTTPSLGWVMSSYGREQSPSGANRTYAAAASAQAGVFEMDQPSMFSTADYLVGPANGYLEAIEHNALNTCTATNNHVNVPISLGDLHVKREHLEPVPSDSSLRSQVNRFGSNWLAEETGPTPSKLRRQLITSIGDDEHLPASRSALSTAYDVGSSTQAVDSPDQEGERRLAGSQLCPTVRQLLMMPPGSSATIAQQPLRVTASNSTAAVDRGSSESAGRFNTGLAARTTLCVAALCLIVLDPSFLFGPSNTPSRSINGKSDAGSSWSSPARRLLLAGDGADGLLGDSAAAGGTGGFLPPVPWHSLALGLVQWTIAILLCLWACVKAQANHQPTSSSTAKYPIDGSTLCWQDGESKGRNSLLWHWRNVDAAVHKHHQFSWSMASQHLNCCLMELGHPLPHPSSKSGDTGAKMRSIGRFRLGTLLNLADCICLRLPRWLYHFYGRCGLPRPTVERVLSMADSSAEAKEACDGEERPRVELSLCAVQHRYMELCLLAKYSGADFSLPSDCAWRLAIGQACNLLSESVKVLSTGATCSPGCQQLPAPKDRVPLCCRHQNAARRLVVSRTVALALFLRHCLGQALLSRICLRMAMRLARCLPARSVWHKCLLNPSLRSVLGTWCGGATDGPGYSRSAICGCVANGPEPLLAYLLPDLRTALSRACCQTVFFGSDAALGDLEADIATLTSLCPCSTEKACADQPCRNGDGGQWWSSLVHQLWCYRRLRLRASSDAGSHREPGGPDAVMPPAAPPPLPPPTAESSDLPGGDLAQALWMAYRCLSNASGSELLTSAESACYLLSEGVASMSGSADRNGDGQPTSPALHEVAWSFVCADWTLLGMTRWLRNAQTLKPHPQRVQWTNAFLKVLEILRQTADHLQLSLSGSGISSCLPRWMSSIISQYEAIGQVIRGANPVVARLSLLHNHRNRCREDVLAHQVPTHSPAPHYPISLSASGLNRRGSQPMVAGLPLLGGSETELSGKQPVRSPRSYQLLVQSPGQ